MKVTHYYGRPVINTSKTKGSVYFKLLAFTTAFNHFESNFVSVEVVRDKM